MKKLVITLIAVLAVMAARSPVLADFYVIPSRSGVGVRIASLPYTIEKPGFYYLAKELSSESDGIIVNADHVTIDLMGFGLSGADGGNGIDLSARNNVVVRNGTVRGFQDGIRATVSADNLQIINVRLMGNSSRGLHIVGSGMVVRQCLAEGNGNNGISVLGEQSVVSGNISLNNGIHGFSVTGDTFNILNNLAAGNGGYGFNVSYVCSTCPYIFNLNMAHDNTSGNINGSPAAAVWGLNSGLP